jgi:hypothetical protein
MGDACKFFSRSMKHRLEWTLDGYSDSFSSIRFLFIYGMLCYPIDDDLPVVISLPIHGFGRRTSIHALDFSSKIRVKTAKTTFFFFVFSMSNH